MNVLRAADRLGGAVALGMALSLFEIVLVGKIDPQETPVGVAVGVVTSIAVVATLAVANVRYALRLSWFWPALLVLRNIVRDTFLVYGVLLRSIAGAKVEDAYEDVPFDPGGDDPASAARRALVVAGMSTSPNEIALAIDERRKRVRVHTLAVSKPSRLSREWPL